MEGTAWTAGSDRRDSVTDYRRPSRPDLTVVLPDRPLRSSRAGELANSPYVAAAMTNAVTDATGRRIGTMPMTPARDRAALNA